MIINFTTFKLFNPNNDYKIIHYDKITEDYKIIETMRNKIVLSGILECNSKIIYGYNKQKKHYKLFKPFNRNFPNFIVSCTESLYNKIITIKFKNWDNEYPIGENLITHGLINSNNNLLTKINIYSNSLLTYSGYSFLKNNNNIINIDNNLYTNKKVNNNFDFICNIDPDNCKDIDDVISYNENTNIIGIHIVDIVSILHNDNLNILHAYILDNNIYNTIYTDNKQINIIPDNIISDYLSLDPNNKRYVWSLYIDIETNEFKLIQEIIINKISYTYDEVDNILKNNNNKYLNIISKFCKNFGYSKYKNIYDNYENHHINSHYIISLLMTIYNNYIGNYLISISNMIYRISGTYILNNNNNFHVDLNINNYTHFTSPIRRFIDQYVHIKLYNYNILSLCINEKYNINDNILNKINLSINDLKIINNRYKLLRLIKKHNIIDGRLIKIDYINNCLKLKWNIDQDINIFNIYNNPLFEDNIIINRLNENEKIKLEINNMYKLKLDISNNINLYIFNTNI